MCYLLTRDTLIHLEQSEQEVIERLLKLGGSVAVLERGRPSHLLCLRGLLTELDYDAKSGYYRRINDAYVKSLCWRAVRPKKVGDKIVGGTDGESVYSADLNITKLELEDDQYTFLHDDKRTISEYVVAMKLDSMGDNGVISTEVIGVLDAKSPIRNGFSGALQRALDALARVLTPMMLADQERRHRRYTELLRQSTDRLLEASAKDSVEDKLLESVLEPAARINLMFSEENGERKDHSDAEDISSSLYIPAIDDGAQQLLVPALGVVVQRSVPANKRPRPIEATEHFAASSVAAAYFGQSLYFWDMPIDAKVPAREVVVHTREIIGGVDVVGKERFSVTFDREDDSNARSALVVPVKGDRVYGVMILEHKLACAYHTIEADALRVLAATLAVALNARAKEKQIRLLATEAKEREKEIRSLASGFAGATIMSRNIAHHIGSHVLAFVTSDLHAMKEWSTGETRYTPDAIYKLLRHLRDRVLFAAIQPTASFSSYVDKALCEQLTEVYDPDALLVTHLVRSRLGLRDLASTDLHRACIEIKEDEPRTVAAVPHGDLGVQAFCALVENLLRNSSNYAEQETVNSIRSCTDTLKIEIQISDKWTPPSTYSEAKDLDHVAENTDTVAEDIESASAATGFSLKSTAPTPEKIQRWVDEFIEVRIVEANKRKVPVVIEKLGVGMRLDEHINERRGTSANLGILEVKLCAAFLRGIKAEDIDSKYSTFRDYIGSEPPILYVRNNDEGELEYRFYLPRPRNVLFVTPRADLAPDRHRKLMSRGCTIVHPAKLSEYVDGKNAIREAIMLFDGSIEELLSALKEIAPLDEAIWYIPYRVLVRLAGSFTMPSGLNRRMYAISAESVDDVVSLVTDQGTDADVAARGVIALAHFEYVKAKHRQEGGRHVVSVGLNLDSTASQSVEDGKLGANELSKEDLPINWVEEGLDIGQGALRYDHSTLKASNRAVFDDSVFYESLVDGKEARRLVTELQFVRERIVPKYLEGSFGERRTWLREDDVVNLHRLKAEIYEPSLTKIAIIDDRLNSVKSDLSRNGKFDQSSGITSEESWRKRGVCVCGEVELIHSFFLKEDSAVLVNKAIHFGYVDVLSVHQQLLKNLRTTSTSETALERQQRLMVLINALKERCGMLVVHTSTGELNAEVMASLGLGSVPWLSYNELAERWMEESKHELHSLMFSLRGVRRSA